jgi:DNA-binding transcriptional LysR family regulator
VDIGIVGAQLPISGIDYMPWLTDRLIPVVAASNTEIPTDLTLQQLTEYTMVGRDSQSGTRITIEEALHKEGMDLSQFPRYISIGSTQGVLGAVAAGMGIAFVSQWVAAPLLKRGELRALSVKGINIERSFYMASWQTSYPIPGVEALKGFLQQHLAKMPEE